MKNCTSSKLKLGLLSLAWVLAVIAVRSNAGEASVVDGGNWAGGEEEGSFAGRDFFLNPQDIGGFLFPHFHAFGAFGDSTANPSDLAVGDHDPNNNATLQTLEPGMSLRAGMLQGYTNASGTTGPGGNFSFVLEEGFLKLIELPLGLELRGGQFYNRFGFQNAVHNHSWTFVDQNLVNGRFLNEGELVSQGGEVSWNVPLSIMQASVMSVSIGGLPSHGHGEGEEHGGESEFEAEGANFAGTLVGANWANQYDINDMKRMTGTLSAAWGDNLSGRDSQVYGMGFEYLWRENGYNPGGKSLRWRTEAMLRHIEAVSGSLHGEEEDHDEEGGHHGEEGGYRASLDEFGIYSMLVFGLDDRIETGIRGDWVSGIDDMGLDERYRVSPMFTWFMNRNRTLQARLQYNLDHSNHFGSEHSVWFQVGFNWGGAEIR